MKNNKRYMAIDQWGNTHHGLRHPRKELSQVVGNQHVSKMYVDLRGGGHRHVGYVVGDYWFSVYQVSPINL